MIARKPVPTDLAERLERLAGSWAADGKVAAVYLFGSRARGSHRPRSDVDLAVVLGASLSAADRWRKRLELIGEANRELGTDAVDLVVLEEAPAVVAHRVLRDGRLFAERDPARRVAVAEQALRRYLDQAALRREVDRAMAERVREGRFGR